MTILYKGQKENIFYSHKLQKEANLSEKNLKTKNYVFWRSLKCIPLKKYLKEMNYLIIGSLFTLMHK